LSAFGLVDDQLDLAPMETVLVGSKVGLHLGDYTPFNAVFDFF
jgi:hypothetical protein